MRNHRCEVCGAAVDLQQTSAHLARVHWFCSEHGRSFHASSQFHAARLAATTAECWRAVDEWFTAAKLEFQGSQQQLAA